MSLRPLPLTAKSGPGGRPRETRAPRNAFGDWCQTTKLTVGQIAEKLGRCESTVYNLRNGYFRPGLDLAHRIERLTRGKVKAESWIEAKARERKRS